MRSPRPGPANSPPRSCGEGSGVGLSPPIRHRRPPWAPRRAPPPAPPREERGGERGPRLQNGRPMSELSETEPAPDFRKMFGESVGSVFQIPRLGQRSVALIVALVLIGW